MSCNIESLLTHLCSSFCKKRGIGNQNIGVYPERFKLSLTNVVWKDISLGKDIKHKQLDSVCNDSPSEKNAVIRSVPDNLPFYQMSLSKGVIEGTNGYFEHCDFTAGLDLPKNIFPGTDGATLSDTLVSLDLREKDQTEMPQLKLESSASAILAQGECVHATADSTYVNYEGNFTASAKLTFKMFVDGSGRKSDFSSSEVEHNVLPLPTPFVYKERTVTWPVAGEMKLRVNHTRVLRVT